MIQQQQSLQSPTAIQMLQNRKKPDWTFGQMDQRARLHFGGKFVDPDDPNYETIKKLILQQYLGQLYGR